MPRLSWTQLLMGMPAKKLEDSIFEIPITHYGPGIVGPYRTLLLYVANPKVRAGLKTAVEVHHIVNGEHLDGTGWAYDSAPCLVMDKQMHQQYHGRFSSVLPEYHGRNIVDPFHLKEKLELYHDMFELQAHWRELWIIAARILTGSVIVPPPRSFQTP